jgi:rSAM/selenodomain-associated transferase 1
MARQERWLLAVVCRNPEAGRVKTRLIPALGEDGARALYRAFLQDLGARFVDQAYNLLWAYTPEGGPPPATLTPGLTLAQEGPDLGHRLLRLFAWATGEGYERVVVISSDVPHLPRAIVDAAFVALERCDVVLAPSDDGGYHLVAMRRAHDVFTMIPMSTPAVLADTQAAIARLGLCLHVLEADFDVDLPEDLPRLADRLARDAALSRGFTARLLRRQRAAGRSGTTVSSVGRPARGQPPRQEEARMTQDEQTRDVTVLIRALSDRIVDVLEQLSTLTDAELDAPCGHPCATAGTVRSLLTHNIDHERMHVGQVYNVRYEAGLMQNGQVARLLAEWLRDRALLISSLYGLTDDDLDRRHAEGEYNIRETIEHVLYWEKDSVDGLLAERAIARGTRLPDQPGESGIARNG